MSDLRLTTPSAVCVRRVIEVVGTRGAGNSEDPIRQVRQYWSADDGDSLLLAEYDPAATDLRLPPF